MVKGVLFHSVMLWFPLPNENNVLCTLSSLCCSVDFFYLKSSFSFSFYLSGIALLISEKLYESVLLNCLSCSFVSSVCDEINQEMSNYYITFISLLNNFRDSY